MPIVIIATEIIKNVFLELPTFGFSVGLSVGSAIVSIDKTSGSTVSSGVLVGVGLVVGFNVGLVVGICVGTGVAVAGFGVGSGVGLGVGDGVVEVRSTNGDTHLGGDNFDTLILEWLIAEFKKDQGIDLKNDKMALQRLKEAAEKAKIELSSAQDTEINLPFITADQTGPKHLQTRLSRAKFDQMTESLVKRSIEPCRKALEDAGLKPSEIDEVVLVGGSIGLSLVVVLQSLLVVVLRVRDNTFIVYRAGHGRVL
jgi:hypothetical protein